MRRQPQGIGGREEGKLTVVDSSELALLELGHQLLDQVLVAVVEHGAGAEALDQVEVAGRGGGDDLVAGGGGQLDGGGADAGAAAPDQDGLAVLGGAQAGLVEAEVVGLKEAGGGGGEGEGQHDALLEGDVAGQLGGAADGRRDDLLEAGLVELLVAEELRVHNDAVAHLVGLLGAAAADLHHLACQVLAQDRGPLADEGAVVLDLPVDRVDGHGLDLDQQLAGARGARVAGRGPELLVLAIEEGGFVLVHHLVVGVGYIAMSGMGVMCGVVGVDQTAEVGGGDKCCILLK